MKQNMQLLNKMLVIAAKSHDGQFDKGGHPYLMHVLTVMSFVNSDDEELNCIALGHDLVEDTDVTFQELLTAGFSKRVVEGIRCLTKQNGETYEEYQNKVFSNVDAMIVKSADLQHNSDIRRLKGVTEKDINRITKYHHFYLEIQKRLSELK